MTTSEITPQQITFPVDLQSIGSPLTRFVGFGGITMTTFGASYGNVPVESVLDGSAKYIEVRASSDGRGYRDEWHRPEIDGPESESVYVERYDTTGRVFHGFVDAISRKIVQVG